MTTTKLSLLESSNITKANSKGRLLDLPNLFLDKFDSCCALVLGTQENDVSDIDDYGAWNVVEKNMHTISTPPALFCPALNRPL